MEARESNTSGTSNSDGRLTSVSSEASTADHQQAMNEYLFPSDSWKNGVYWAELPPKERLQFINEQQNKEWGFELAGIWADFKSDPMLPFLKYWRNYVMP